MTIQLSILDQAPVPEGATPAEALSNTLDLARHADRLGYHRYWVAEHHAMQSHAAAAPEVLIGAVAAATRTIRVGSGGVLLTHYSPFKVAEVFRTLSALYPGRIDLGIGRSTGAGAVEASALDPIPLHLKPTVDEKIATLQGLLTATLPAGHPLRDVQVTPADAAAPGLWLLGSSVDSAAAAATLGVNYAFAHFLNPAATSAAIARYRQLRPAGAAIVAIYAAVADSDAEAQRIFATQRAVRNRILRNDTRPIPEPSRALRELGSTGDVLGSETSRWPRYFAGTARRVGNLMRELADELAVEEFSIVTTVYDHRARIRSYELLAEEFALTRA